MDPTEKLTDAVDIITYLHEKFPLCFILEGDRKPLKIGIFQDLVISLENDLNISKTQLRTALRRYTSDWDYLKCIQEGAMRVDLNGEESDPIAKEQALHALESLKKAQNAVKAKKQATKLTPSEVLNKLLETYPLCFVSNDYKPLKLEIENDLLKDKNLGLNEAQIKNAIKFYTSNWNYLKCIKAESDRVSLTGEVCSKVTEEDASAASSQLQLEITAVKAKRKGSQPEKKIDRLKDQKEAKFKKVISEIKQSPEVVIPIVYETLKDLTQLELNQKVKIKLGAVPVVGTVIDLKRDDVQVRLDSGLTVKVKAANIILEN